MPTNIEWADETINPIVGCTKVSAGCRNCYAEKMAWRLKCVGHPQYQDVVDKNGWTGNIGQNLDAFAKLPKYNSKKVFVCSMGDLFHENVSFATLRTILFSIFIRPQHKFLLLTKRPDRMAILLNQIYSKYYDGMHFINLWLGVTAENRKRADERIPILLQIPAKVRFVSVEPMLEYINIFPYLGPEINIHMKNPEARCGHHGNLLNRKACPDCFPDVVDWVIAGPETGPGARLCPEGAIEDLYDQCKAAGVKFFDKRPNFFAREFPK